MSDWNSAQYLKFKNERTRPAIDLLNMISLKNPAEIIDIGCGPGNSTFILRERYPEAHILGIDNSENMINTAKASYSSIDFALCNAETELCKIDKKFDIVFSNACIQWIPEHKKLLTEMMALLRNGGVMAVQIPVNFEEPIHRIIKATAAESKWSSHFDNAREFYTLTESEYFDILSEISSDFSMQKNIYHHRMKSHDDIMEWYRSTGLRPYLNQLSDELKPEFENDVFKQLVEAYPVQKNGEIIFRFPRLFFTAFR